MTTNLVSKLFVPVGGIAVLALLFTLAVPRTAHAILGALVQVTNTAANPAITQDTSKQAAQIVNLVCPLNSGIADCFHIDGHGVVSASQFVVPSNLHLIITSLVLDSPAQALPVNCQVTLFDKTVGKFNSQFQDLGFSNLSNSLTIPFTPGIVIDGNAQPALSGGCNATSAFFNQPSYYLHGYLTAN
jgi:hypothetical protein